MARFNTSQFNTSLFNTQFVPKISVLTPLNPRSYLGASENAYVFLWTLQCCTTCVGGSPAPFNQYDFELCIDTDPTFSSPNLRCFNGMDAVTGFGIGGFGDDGFGIGGFTGGARGLVGYSKGQLVISYEVAFPIRAEDQTIPYYWRVRVLSATLESPWTDTQTLTRDDSLKTDITNRIFATYPDENVYTKDVNSTYVYILAKEYARQIEEMSFESIRAKRDIYLESVRDESLYNNFGILYSFSPRNQTLQEYREQLIQLKDAYEYSGTISAVNKIVKAFTCREPDIIQIKDLTGWRIFSKTDPEPNRPHYYIRDPLNPTLSPIVTIYSKAEKAHAFILTVHNTFGLAIDQDYLRQLIIQLIPADSKVELVFTT
jgi:hypothetical protein